jgi:hypothetical protein
MLDEGHAANFQVEVDEARKPRGPDLSDARMRYLLQRAERAAQREVTAKYTPQDRANYRINRQHQLQLDRPSVAERMGEQIGIVLSANMRLPDSAKSSRHVVAVRTDDLNAVESAMRRFLLLGNYPAAFRRWTPEISRRLVQGQPGPGME